MKNKLILTPALRELVTRHFVQLQQEEADSKWATLSIPVTGYSDVMYLVSDLVKVCILALDGEGGHPRVPEPMSNIRGVMALVLDLIPFEEVELLDHLREAVREGELSDTDYVLEDYILIPPACLGGEQWAVGSNQ